jgi:hypothetical protein
MVTPKSETAGSMCTNWHNLFTYKDGWLYWRVATKGTSVGDKAGNKKGSGYWQVCVDGKWYQLHRVIWEMFNGQIPENLEVDHEDRNTDNNLINNLRLATRSQNAFNRGV